LRIDLAMDELDDLVEVEVCQGSRLPSDQQVPQQARHGHPHLRRRVFCVRCFRARSGALSPDGAVSSESTLLSCFGGLGSGRPLEEAQILFVGDVGCRRTCRCVRVLVRSLPKRGGANSHFHKNADMNKLAGCEMRSWPASRGSHVHSSGRVDSP